MYLCEVAIVSQLCISFPYVLHGLCEDYLTCDIAFNAVMPLSRDSTRGRYSRIEGVTAPSGEAPEQAPRWDLVGTEGCGGGIRFLAPVLIVWGYVGIYRRKKYVGGALRGPRGRGRALGGGRAPHPRDRRVAFLTEGPSLMGLI